MRFVDFLEIGPMDFHIRPSVFSLKFIGHFGRDIVPGKWLVETVSCRQAILKSRGVEREILTKVKSWKFMTFCRFSRDRPGGFSYPPVSCLFEVRW